MGGRLSPGRFFDCLLAEYDITVVELCRRSGLSGGEVLRILSDFQPVTPSLAEKLGLAFYSPGFWLVRQAMWEHVMMQHGE